MQICRRRARGRPMPGSVETHGVRRPTGVGRGAGLGASEEGGRKAVRNLLFLCVDVGRIVFSLRRGESDSEVARKVGRFFLLHNGWRCTADSFSRGGAGAITNEWPGFGSCWEVGRKGGA